MPSRTEISPILVNALLQRERILLTARLLPGVVHNLSGAVQMISLPLDLAQLSLEKGEMHNIDARLSSVRQGLSRLVDEVNLLAARSHGDQRRGWEPLDLARLAEEQLAFWHGDLFFKHEVTLKRELTADMGWPKAAYVDVSLALNALMANAVEAVRQGGKPWVAVRNFAGGGRFGLEVSDGGPGPAPEVAAADLFAPFSGSKGEEHDGLGLFLAAKALEPWGGAVVWRREAPDTTFAIELPAG